MAYARQLVRGSKKEFALLQKHESEPFFGVQLAAGRVEDAIEASRIAVDKGADFIDLNCGCPIHDVVKRGMGSTLLQRPNALARIVEAMVGAVDVPVTVKIRSGWKESQINALEIGRLCQDAGAQMLTLHGRTREQRYTKSANWDLVADLVRELDIPVVGNGDILTWHEGESRRQSSDCASVMLARGALIKPWLFSEFEDKTTRTPSADERLEIYLRLVTFMKEHFGADDRGRKRAFFFLPWHFGFLTRYRPMPDAEFRDRALEHPLMQTRDEAFETVDEPLERILRDPRESTHQAMADALWDADGDLGAAREALLTIEGALEDPSAEASEVRVAQG